MPSEGFQCFDLVQGIGQGILPANHGQKLAFGEACLIQGNDLRLKGKRFTVVVGNEISHALDHHPGRRRLVSKVVRDLGTEGIQHIFVAKGLVFGKKNQYRAILPVIARFTVSLDGENWNSGIRITSEHRPRQHLVPAIDGNHT